MARFRHSWPLWPSGLGFGLLAHFLGLPMPFMLGGIVGAGVAVAVLESRHGPRDLRPPRRLREIFIALIGTMIGATFSPELLAVLPLFWPTALAIFGFIALAHLGGYQILRRLGGYSRPDALFGAMPGGLVEASILGERAGADVRLMTVQHFIRVTLVVVLVPLLFWLVTGQVVGSAGGQSFGNGQGYDAWDIAQILGLAPVGLALGKATRLPAAHLMGPLTLCAVLHLSGLVAIASPPWLLYLAQLVVGVGLGAQFSGITGAMLLRGLGTGFVAVSYMLTLSLGFALALRPFVPADAAVLFLTFSPGGVTEMSLIALSLHASPIVVAAHHLIRIVATVFVAQAIGRRIL